ncbi:MAG: hypothetical protein U1F43_17390 [Myxococcota bacterium]
MTIARVLAILAGAMALVPRAPALVRMLAPVVGLLALMAVTGRSELLGRPFAEAHAASFGIPSELAFVLLGVGATRLRTASDAVTRGLFALGLGWSTLVLAAPDVVHARTMWAFGAASSPVVTLAIGALALAVLGGWVLAVRRARTPRPVAAIASAAPWIAAAAVALGTLATGPGPLAGYLAAALVAFLGLALTRAAAALDAPATPDARSRDKAWLAAELAIVAVVVGLWLLLKTHALIASNTDENIYFYMARMLGMGKLPTSTTSSPTLPCTCSCRAPSSRSSATR